MNEPTLGLPAKTIDDFTTRELVEALKSKPGASYSLISSSAFISLEVDGPADILVVRKVATPNFGLSDDGQK